MPVIQPYLGASATRLTALVNHDNQGQPHARQLQYGVDFVFGAPVALTGDPNRNTTVVMHPLPGSGANKDTPIHYTRLPLDVLNALPEGWISPVTVPSEGFSIHGILDLINEALGLSLIPEEVYNDVYTNGNSPSYPLRIRDEVCLTWIGSNFRFAATGDAVSLADAIPNNHLTGLVF